MKFENGQRVQHKDESYACYGTVVGTIGVGVLVLWDAVDEPVPDAIPDIEPADALRPV